MLIDFYIVVVYQGGKRIEVLFIFNRFSIQNLDKKMTLKDEWMNTNTWEWSTTLCTFYVEESCILWLIDGFYT